LFFSAAREVHSSSSFSFRLMPILADNRLWFRV
jgi:hypothetical protein